MMHLNFLSATKEAGKLSEPNAPKGLHNVARGKRSVTLGRVDKIKPILTLKGLHKNKDSPANASIFGAGPHSCNLF